MGEYALVKEGVIVNVIVADPGWAHPEGELVPTSLLTESEAERRGIKFARNMEELKKAYTENATVALPTSDQQILYDLMFNPIPEGCLLRSSSGSTGRIKQACIPWSKAEVRAQAFIEMMGDAFEGPVWFPDSFKSTPFASTGRIAYMLHDIECFFGLEDPPVPVKVVGGAPHTIFGLIMKGRLPQGVTIITTAHSVTDEMRYAFLRATNLFIDFYSSSDGGAILMNKYRDGIDEAETVFPKTATPVVGVDGVIEVPLEQAAVRYLTHELLVRNGRFLTLDRAVPTGKNSMKLVRRA